MSSMAALLSSEYLRTKVRKKSACLLSMELVMDCANFSLRFSLTSSTDGSSISSKRALVTRSMERSMRRSRGVTNRMASPERPARPVRPMRCT